MVNGLWKELRSAEDIQAEREAEEARMAEKVAGLARCPKCGGEAKICVFGAEKQGVWVGCDREDGCVRYIAWHKEGWSIDEVCEEWNRLNGGVWRLVRQVKNWLIDRFGKVRREERRMESARKQARKARRKARAEMFGIELGRRRRFRRLISR